MNRIFKLSASAVILISAGCASEPPAIINANFGDAPPASYKADIKEMYSHTLRDPSSAQYRFLKPLKGYVRFSTSPFTNTDWRYGYIVQIYINAKNAFGAYTGEQLHYVLFSSHQYQDVTDNFIVGNGGIVSK